MIKAHALRETSWRALAATGAALAMTPVPAMAQVVPGAAPTAAPSPAAPASAAAAPAAAANGQQGSDSTSSAPATSSAPPPVGDQVTGTGADSGPGGNDVVVTGFRASLRNSIDAKRTSNVQIDAINAQDIADFPDANLAESLQRLPGVSIDRDNGEGRSITVRGLSGDFNRTRLNGLEALSTAGSNDSGTTPNRSRAFDYNTFASELFSSLKVQKSSSAETDEGSLGATIDLTTGRPFDFGRRTLAISIEDNYNENGSHHQPRIAGLISAKTADGRFGLLFSGAYSRTRNEIDSYGRQAGQADYLYRSSDFTGNENPQRAGFSAPTGTNFGTAITNPQAIAFQTGSDPAAYAKLYPGAPYNTPGRFDDSIVRIPTLATLQQQNVKNERLGLTGSFQWQVGPRTLINVDGVYSRFHNESTFYQIQTVGLNRNNTNATYNTAVGRQTPNTARGLYPGICTPAAVSDLAPTQDCGNTLYGTTPAFATALNAAGVLSPSVLGTAAVVPGATSPANANIFSVNPFNLDPYDYYNNPNSVGYIPSTNALAFRGELIGRPSVDVLDADVQNGVADYLQLRNVDFRSAADASYYTTEFRQGSINLQHEFTDNFRVDAIYGESRSTNNTTGLLVEYNRMDSPATFTYDERGGGAMPRIDFGFDAADPSQWQVVKGFSAIRHYERVVRNTYRTAKADFDWRISPEYSLAFGGSYRRFGFFTDLLERNTDTLNPTLLEAGSTTAATGQVIQFGQGLNTPAGTATSFYAPRIEAFEQLFDFECNCVNKYGDWTLTNKRSGAPNRYSVTENDKSAYLQLDFDVELFGRRLRGNSGLRVAFTSVLAQGNTQNGRPITGTNNYTDYLPSLNLNYEVTHNFIVRVAAASVMARPLLGNLSPVTSGLSVPTDGSNSGARLTVGNPRLSPFRSTNEDVSLEYYFGRGGLLSLAAFNKSIRSFPQTIVLTVPLTQILEPDAIAAIRGGTTNTNSLAYIDADYPFDVRQYQDAPGGYLRGVEVSYQQDFTFLPGPLRNFGAILNYTYIKSELNYILDPGTIRSATVAAVAPTTAKAPFLGVSPQSFNATLYYETSGFRARIVGAYRKGYSTTFPIAAGSCSPGIVTPVPASPATIGATANQPGGYCSAPLVNDFIFSRSTFNLDASASYKFTSWFSVEAEAQNLTNQTSQRYAYQAQPVATQYAAAGRIYRVGARLRF
ncbi:TonB-dependent receptor domain-containing protein [Sphingomonas sp.]|uniref:TonB-dependent receptor domain-containing protein n=1 Tax=Sphingomonas sp. TaxID=28214 RepID=UPI003CC63207